MTTTAVRHARATHECAIPTCEETGKVAILDELYCAGCAEKLGAHAPVMSDIMELIFGDRRTAA